MASQKTISYIQKSINGKDLVMQNAITGWKDHDHYLEHDFSGDKLRIESETMKSHIERLLMISEALWDIRVRGANPGGTFVSIQATGTSCHPYN